MSPGHTSETITRSSMSKRAQGLVSVRSEPGRWRKPWRLLTGLKWNICLRDQNEKRVLAIHCESRAESAASDTTQMHHRVRMALLDALISCVRDWRLPKDSDRERRNIDSFPEFLVIWALIPIIFFSLSKSKLPGYILPAIPPLMLLAARSVSIRAQKKALGGRWPAIVTGLMLVGIAGLTTAFMQEIPFAVDLFPPQPLGWAIFLVLVGGLASIFLGIRHRTLAALSVCVFSLIVAIPLSLTGDSGRALNAGISAAPAGPSHLTANTSAYKLSRSFQYALNFYQHREVPEWSPDATQAGWVFVQAGQMNELRALGLKCPAFMASPAVVVCEDPGLPGRASDRRKAQ